MTTYSFQQVKAAVNGPGGIVNIGNGSGAAEEGITIEMLEDKDLPQTGADGTLQHSLRAGNVCKATVRMLKTSPANNALMQMFNLQKAAVSLAAWGHNIITVSNPFTGDQEVVSSAAFVRAPTNTYSKDGPMMEWEFFGNRDSFLGTYAN